MMVGNWGRAQTEQKGAPLARYPQRAITDEESEDKRVGWGRPLPYGIEDTPTTKVLYEGFTM